MGMTKFELVAHFNQVVVGVEPREKGLQGADEVYLSHNQLVEEAHELVDSWEDKNYIGCVDAAIDSIVFALGILYKLGLNSDEFSKCFEAVMDANLTKKGGVNPNRVGFGNSGDAVKPEGWVPPEGRIAEILGIKND